MRKYSQALFIVLAALLLQACLWDSNNEEEIPPQKRYVRWGLKLQIGNYVLDSIFTPPDSELAGRDYNVSMDNICGIESGCDTVPRIGKIYGWDSTCFSMVSFSSVSQGVWEKFHVDSEGMFDFSELPLEVQGGVTFWFTLELRDIKKCKDDPSFPRGFNIYFNLYNF